MKAAIVRHAGATPEFGDFPAPVPSGELVEVRVAAAAISQLTRSRATGQHYSASARFPFVPGVDGVGRTDDGRRVYFAVPEAPHGAMAETTLVRADHCVAVDDGIDDALAAAIANPGMSSWAALTERARLKPGETVLVNGATGVSGRLAVRIARHLGASRVIATGRNVAALATVGADVTIPLIADPVAQEAAFRPVIDEGVDVVLDYLWGPSAEALLRAAARSDRDGLPLRHVEIGSLGGGEITLPGAVLRASAIELMGSGIGSIAFGRLMEVAGAVLAAAATAGLAVPVRQMALPDVAAAWAAPDDGRRIVLTP